MADTALSLSELTIPESPAELSSDWLTSALKTSLDQSVDPPLQIATVDQQVLGEGEGFLGDLLRLTPHYTGNVAGAPATLIAKLPKLANRPMGELLGAYERENMFYMTMADELPVATPKMYYGEFDRDAGSEKQLEILRALNKLPTWTHGALSRMGAWVAARKRRRYILLIEDIADAAPGDQVAGADRATATVALETLAKLHATYWRSPSLEGHFWLLPLDIDGRMKHAISKRSWPVFQTTFPDILDAGLRAHCEHSLECFNEDLAMLCRGPETLLHGDMRLDNLFFREPGSVTRDSEVVLFDWQLVRRGPAAYDVAYLLSGGLAVDYETTQGRVDELLDVYHAALVSYGVDDYSRTDLQRDYRLALSVVLGSLITVDQMDLGDDRGVRMMRLWIERLLARLQALEPPRVAS